MKIMDIITPLVAVLGALAWLAPLVYDKLSKAKIKSRLVSERISPGIVRGEEVCINFLALNIISLNKSYQIKDIEIRAKYKGIDNYYIGEWMWLDEYTLMDGNGIGKHLSLKITPENTLPFIGTLPKDNTIPVYLLFKTNNNQAGILEYEDIEITFIDFKGKFQIINLDIPEALKKVHDDRIWKELN